MEAVAIVFQTTPYYLTIHITDQPKELIDSLLHTRIYELDHYSVVVEHFYGRGKVRSRMAWDAITIADTHHIGAYWIDTKYVLGEHTISQFTKRAIQYGRDVNTYDALMILYSHSLV